MATPKFDFPTADVVRREQEFTLMMEMLHAKDQEIAALQHLNHEQERLITGLCDQLSDDRAKTLPPPLQALLTRFRTH